MLSRTKLQAEIAQLRAANLELRRRYDAVDLQRRLLLDQIIAMKSALDAEGIELTFGENHEQQL